jgi:hypothetical protein
MTTKYDGKPTLILDKHRGVYMVHKVLAVRETPAGVAVDAEGMRHIFNYPIAKVGNKGVYGLAVVGPGAGAKVGPAVNGTIYDVVKVIEATDDAMKGLAGVKW